MWCTFVSGASVYDEDGNVVSMVVSAKTGVGHSTVCRCLTLEEGLSGDFREEVNDEALEVCLENAAAMGYPEANDCHDIYNVGTWGDFLGFYPPWEDKPLPCEDSGSPGCNLR